MAFTSLSALSALFFATLVLVLATPVHGFCKIPICVSSSSACCRLSSRSVFLPRPRHRDLHLEAKAKQSSDQKLPFVAAFRDSVDSSPKNDSDLIAERLYTGPDGAAVKAFKASPAMKTWLTFATEKQIEATGTDVLCLPWDEISQTRRQDVMNALRGVLGSGDEVRVDPDCGRNVVLVGAAGIGKSSEMNFYLREFVCHMGEENWPRTVLYRCPERIITVQLDKKQRITSYALEKEMTLRQLSTKIRSQFKDAIENKDMILLLELDEEESDPKFSCRTLVSLSARDAMTVAKTMDKSGAHFFIANPPSPQQMELMAKAVLELSDGKQKLLKNLGVKEGEAEVLEALEVVRERVEQVGPLPRIVFGSAIELKKRLFGMRSPPPELFSELGKADIFDVPARAKFFVAPFVRSDAPSSLAGEQTADGQEIAELSFLCERAARLVANAAEEEYDAKTLRRGLLDYQIAEVFMRDALMNVGKRDSWDAHEDVGPGVFLNTSSRLKSEVQDLYKNGTLIPVMKVKDHFRGKFCTKKVSEMEEHTLYWSLSHNMVVGECLAVDHEKKIVFAFQSTALDPSEHAFKASTLLTMMGHIGMKDPKHKDYKLKIVVFADISREKTHGCAFNYDLEGGVKVKKLEKQEKDTAASGGGGSGGVGGEAKKDNATDKRTSKLSLKAFIEMAEKDKTPLLTRIETVIIRGRYYALLPAFHLEGTSTK